MTRAIVLGAGPAGLFAAWALMKGGADVIIMSKPRKSFMKGAQYLHRPIPEMTQSDPFPIEYTLQGTVEGYREKVYGKQRGINVSVETLVGVHDAWDIREAYDNAWALLGPAVQPLELTGTKGEISKIKEWAKPDIIVSSVPAQLLCENPAHVFYQETVWSTDRAHIRPGEDNVVVCSGEPDYAWYRQSRIHGWENTEYPASRKPPITPLWEVVKPIGTTCDCHPDIVRVGRYGRWTKGVLSDSAYYDIAEMSNTGVQGALF